MADDLALGSVKPFLHTTTKRFTNFLFTPSQPRRKKTHASTSKLIGIFISQWHFGKTKLLPREFIYDAKTHGGSARRFPQRPLGPPAQHAASWARSYH
jgi:hypothetical protein